jgi:ParB/RepB/Spo0J family partition protein
MIHSTQETVPLDTIKTNDKRYIITFGGTGTLLKKSIQETGLLNPPYLIYDHGAGGYIIVSGFRRITAAQDIGWKHIPACIISAPDDHHTLLTYALQENLSHRQLNIVEKARTVSKLLTVLPSPEVMDTWLPLLEFSPGKKTLSLLQAIAECSPEIQHAILEGTITEKTAAALSEMNPDSSSCLFTLFSKANLSASKQREVIESCRDLSRRHDTSISRLLTSPDIETILDSPNTTRSQKGDAVLSLLRKMRYPVLRAQETRFNTLKKNLRLPPNVSLLPPPQFEGNTFRLELTFRSADEFEKTAAALQCVVGRHDFLDFIDKT